MMRTAMHTALPPAATLPPPTPEKEWLSIKDVSRRLNCHPTTLRRYVRDGFFPAPTPMGLHGVTKKWHIDVVYDWEAAHMKNGMLVQHPVVPPGSTPGK